MRDDDDSWLVVGPAPFPPLPGRASTRGADQATAVTVVGLPARLVEVWRWWSQPQNTRSSDRSSACGAQDGTAPV